MHTFSKLAPSGLAALVALLVTASAALADGGSDMQVPLASDAVGAVGLLGGLAAAATAYLRRR